MTTAGPSGSSGNPAGEPARRNGPDGSEHTGPPTPEAPQSASSTADVPFPDPGTGEPPAPVHPARGPNEIALGGVLLAVVVGLALVGQDHWRRGLLLAGAGLLAGAVVRLVLPARVAGLLAVRGRIFDSVVLAVLGTAVIVLTSSVPLPPGSG
jgi:hypothetical protein